MFDRMKQSMVIEKAYLIWSRDMGLDVKNLVSKLSFPEAASYREQLRDMQSKMGLDQYDVVVMMVIPFLSFLDGDTKGDIEFAVDQWSQKGLVQPDVSSFFKQKLRP